LSATATTFGNGVWGITNEETGIIIESISHNFTNSNKTIKDRTGNTSSVTYYDEMAKVSLKGKIPKTSAFSQTLATSLTLGNTLSAYLKGGNSGLVIIENITIDMGNEEYRGISIDATNFPNILS
jgi:hypothetical protein